MTRLFLETARYLGYKGSKPDKTVSDMINECLATVEKSSFFMTKYVRCEVSVDEESVKFGKVNIKSKTLAFHLKDCHAAYFLCATLGAEIDKLLMRYSVSDIAKCSVLQAAASAYLEQLLEEHCMKLEAREREIGNATHTRYSAGYGDFPLSYNKDIISFCSADKIGMGTTDAYALTPSKSVTAVIGIYRE